jgi:hypothetical protein
VGGEVETLAQRDEKSKICPFCVDFEILHQFYFQTSVDGLKLMPNEVFKFAVVLCALTDLKFEF